MRAFTASLLLLLSAVGIYGKTSFNQEIFKQLISSNMKQIPSNSASCSDLDNDVNKCTLNSPATCNQAQDYINCAVGYVENDCGCGYVQGFCDTLLPTIASLPCTFTCKPDSLCSSTDSTTKSNKDSNSANSLIIYSCISGILLYKMFVEKIILIL